MKNALFLAVLAVFAAGCTTLDKGHDRIIDKGQEWIDDYYCPELSYSLRMKTREKFNPTPKGNSGQINCAGDPE